MAEFYRTAAGYNAGAVDPNLYGLSQAAFAVAREQDALIQRQNALMKRYQDETNMLEEMKKQERLENRSRAGAVAKGQVDPAYGMIKRPTNEGFVWDQ